MKLNKKVIESAAVLAYAGLLTITAVTNSENTVATEKSQMTSAEAAEQTVIANTCSLDNEGIAGVTATLNNYQQRAVLEDISFKTVDADVVTASEDDSNEDATIEREKKEDVAEAQEDEEPANEDSKQEDSKQEKSEQENSMQKEWSDKLMADVDEFLYVREKESGDSSIVGKLYKGDRALIIKKGDKWTKIESGSVSGYVKNEYCVMGDAALEYAKKNCGQVATVEIDGLRIREKQDTDSSVITAVASGEKLKIKKSADVKDGWIAVVYDGKTRYVSEEFVTVSYDTGKAITLEQEQAQLAAQNHSEASTSQSSSSQKNGATRTKKSSVAVGADDVTLLAALIQCEAGGCSYNAQLAVGNVVVNRVKSGAFPNSVYKVIYQRGQFGPASSGKLARRIRNGVSSTARRAAQAALSGADNTNGAKYFKLASSGHKGVKYGPIVFY